MFPYLGSDVNIDNTMGEEYLRLLNLKKSCEEKILQENTKYIHEIVITAINNLELKDLPEPVLKVKRSRSSSLRKRSKVGSKMSMIPEEGVTDGNGTRLKRSSSKVRTSLDYFSFNFISSLNLLVADNHIT